MGPEHSLGWMSRRELLALSAVLVLTSPVVYARALGLNPKASTRPRAMRLARRNSFVKFFFNNYVDTDHTFVLRWMVAKRQRRRALVLHCTLCNRRCAMDSVETNAYT